MIFDFLFSFESDSRLYLAVSALFFVSFALFVLVRITISVCVIFVRY